MENTAQATAAVYDASAEQHVDYQVTGDGEKYTMVQVYAPLDDEVILEYDRLREVLLEGGDDQTEVKTI